MQAHIGPYLNATCEEVCASEAGEKCSSMTSPLTTPRQLMRLRSGMWRQYKEMKRIHGHHSVQSEEAQEVSFNYRNFSFRSRLQYEQNLVERSLEAPNFYTLVVTGKRKAGCRQAHFFMVGRYLIDNPLVVGKLLVAVFSSVILPNPRPPQSHLTGHQSESPMGKIIVQQASVQRVLESLGSFSSAGPDNGHLRLLKRCAKQISLPLTLIFRKSLLREMVNLTYGWSRW